MYRRTLLTRLCPHRQRVRIVDVSGAPLPVARRPWWRCVGSSSGEQLAGPGRCGGGGGRVAPARGAAPPGPPPGPGGGLGALLRGGPAGGGGRGGQGGRGG